MGISNSDNPLDLLSALQPLSWEERTQRLAELSPSLRADLQRLLEVADSAPASFLESPPTGVREGHAPLKPSLSSQEPGVPPPGNSSGVEIAGRPDYASLNAPPMVSIVGYRVLREISRGGQAVVCEAIQQSTGRKVAIKIMREGPLASPRERARFDREVQVLAALKHPNIVRVVDRGATADGSFFLVMDYVGGPPLDEWLLQYYRAHPDGPPPSDPSELLRVFLKICDAVSAAHLRGIVHRDLKPPNIRMDENGEPIILDFGLARTAFTAMTDEQTPQPVSITGQFMGSLPWASPEQAEGIPEKIDIRSDVYSLGVILYQMLTGRFPYQVAGTMRDVLNNIITATPPPPSQTMAAKEAREAKRRMRIGKKPRPALNPVIDAIVLKALGKRREDRYQSAGELARDLGNYLAGRPTTAGAPVPSRSNWPPIAAALILICIAVAAGAWAMNRKPHRIDVARLSAASTQSVARAAAVPAPPVLNSYALDADGVERRIDSDGHRVVNLMPLIDPKNDALAGTWTKRPDGVASDDWRGALLWVRYDPPAEYDLRVELTRLSGDDAVTVGLSRTGRFVWQFSMGASTNTVSCFHWLTGEATGLESIDNPTRIVHSPALRNRQRNVVTVRVRTNGFSASVNDLEVKEYRPQWPQFYRRETPWACASRGLSLGSFNSPSVFHKFELVEIAGAGRPIPAPVGDSRLVRSYPRGKEGGFVGDLAFSSDGTLLAIVEPPTSLIVETPGIQSSRVILSMDGDPICGGADRLRAHSHWTASWPHVWLARQRS